MAPAIVVEQVAGFEKDLYQYPVAAIPEFVSKEPLQALLVGTDLSQGLRTTDARVDMVLKNMAFQIGAERNVLF
jgi:hypothetical protein